MKIIACMEFQAYQVPLHYQRKPSFKTFLLCEVTPCYWDLTRVCNALFCTGDWTSDNRGADRGIFGRPCDPVQVYLGAHVTIGGRIWAHGRAGSKTFKHDGNKTMQEHEHWLYA